MVQEVVQIDAGWSELELYDWSKKQVNHVAKYESKETPGSGLPQLRQDEGIVFVAKGYQTEGQRHRAGKENHHGAKLTILRSG